MDEHTATHGEAMITEMVFNALGMDDENLELDFADNGYEILVLDKEYRQRYVISVREC